MKSDIEIARETPLMKIEEIARKVGIDPEHIFHYGHYIAKVDLSQIDEEKIKKPLRPTRPVSGRRPCRLAWH